MVNRHVAILAVAPPSRGQMHAPNLPTSTRPQAMIYQAIFGDHAGQDSHGSTVIHTRASILVDTGSTQDFVGERARSPTSTAWSSSYWRTCSAALSALSCA